MSLLRAAAQILCSSVRVRTSFWILRRRLLRDLFPSLLLCLCQFARKFQKEIAEPRAPLGVFLSLLCQLISALWAKSKNFILQPFAVGQQMALFSIAKFCYRHIENNRWQQQHRFCVPQLESELLFGSYVDVFYEIFFHRCYSVCASLPGNSKKK